MDSDETRSLLIAGLDAWRITYSEERIAQFLTYRDILVDWNAKRMNLTRLVSPREIAAEHFLDSASLLTVLTMPQGATLLDVGAGAGFPSLPLKILRPDLKVTLLEATGKKLLFCRAVADALELSDVETIHGRAEQPHEASHRRFDFVTARAVAAMDVLTGWCETYMKRERSVFAALKGANAAAEVADAKQAIQARKLAVNLRKIDIPGSEKTHFIALCSRSAPTGHR